MGSATCIVYINLLVLLGAGLIHWAVWWRAVCVVTHMVCTNFCKEKLSDVILVYQWFLPSSPCRQDGHSWQCQYGQGQHGWACCTADPIAVWSCLVLGVASTSTRSNGLFRVSGQHVAA